VLTDFIKKLKMQHQKKIPMLHQLIISCRYAKPCNKFVKLQAKKKNKQFDVMQNIADVTISILKKKIKATKLQQCLTQT
jgi:hypothetical protein